MKLLDDKDNIIIEGTYKEIAKYCTTEDKKENPPKPKPNKITYEYIGNYELMKDGTQYEKMKNFKETMDFFIERELYFDKYKDSDVYKRNGKTYFSKMTDEDYIELLKLIDPKLTNEDILMNDLYSLVEDAVKNCDSYSYEVY